MNPSKPPKAPAPDSNLTPPADPQPVTTEPTNVNVVPKGSRSNKLIGLLVVTIVIVGGYFGYAHFKPSTESKVPVAVKHDVPLIRFGEGDSFSTTFYPNSTQTDSDADVTTQVFEGLTGFDQTTRIVPRLALSWTNPDSSTWIFKLRPNVKFHSGHTMTADDVKASLALPLEGDYSGYTDTIKSVSVVDPLTVKIVTNTPDAILTSKLAFVNIIDTKSGKSDDPINGTGPYSVKTGTTPTSDEVSLVAYDNYWGGHVYTRAIDFKAYSDFDKLADDLATHKLDAGFVETKANADKAVKAQGFVTSQSPGIDVAELVPNTLKVGSPLAKPTVRKAIGLGTDVAAIMNARGLQGEPTGQILTPQEAGYNTDIKPVTYDPVQAKALLAQAGYPNGFKTSLTYFNAAQDLADEVKTQMAKIGVMLTLKPQSDSATTADLAYGGKSDMYYNSIASTFNDGADVFAAVLTQSKNYQNAKINTLYDQMQSTIDSAKRLSLLKQISQAASDDTAVIPLYTPDLYYVYASNLVQSRDISADAAGVYFWKVYQK